MDKETVDRTEDIGTHYSQDLTRHYMLLNGVIREYLLIDEYKPEFKGMGDVVTFPRLEESED